MERPDNCPDSNCFIIHILSKVDEVHADEILRSSCELCIRLANNQKVLDTKIKEMLEHNKTEIVS